VARRSAEPAVPDDSAYLHILRESACQGPIFLNIQLDGQRVAQLEKSTNHTARLAPGEHRLHVAGWKLASRNLDPAEQTIHLNPSEELDLLVSCTRQGWFKHDSVIMKEYPWRGKVRDGRPAARSSFIDWSQYDISCYDQGLSMEPAGRTSFIEDNRQGDTPVRRQQVVRHEWVRTVSVGAEQTDTRGISLGLNVGWLTIEWQVEQAVTRQFSITGSERHSFEQAVETEVPARSCIQVFIEWKHVWRHGFVRVTGPRGYWANIPYRFIYGVEFDRSIVRL
jgi:hypothetical protein